MDCLTHTTRNLRVSQLIIPITVVSFANDVLERKNEELRTTYRARTIYHPNNTVETEEYCFVRYSLIVKNRLSWYV
jgi:hypothetical protein